MRHNTKNKRLRVKDNVLNCLIDFAVNNPHKTVELWVEEGTRAFTGEEREVIRRALLQLTYDLKRPQKP